MNAFRRGVLFVHPNMGGILIMTLVFVTMFVVIFAALSGITSRQYHLGVLQSQDERAFQIAEAGLNYARWRLAHDPENLLEETRDVDDQLGDSIGSYTITFTSPQEGSTITTIHSEGVTSNQPSRTAELEATYGVPSLAKYAGITNGDVWYGGEVSGAIHSNGGIRMDAESDSIVSSAKETYTCTSIHGCDNETKPGVWGAGSNSDLWEFPVPPVDYASITLDLQDMKTAAEAAGTYFDPSNKFGYHIIFNSNNTYTVNRVSKLQNSVWSYSTEDGWLYNSYDIKQETHVKTGTVPSGGVMFFEDDLWVSGDIRDRVTVAAGVFPDEASTNVDIIIAGNISYGGVKDGSRVFGAIAQRNVLIPYSGAPDNLTMDGAYIAQKGRFGRRYYGSGTYNLRSSLTRYGMIASNTTPGTAWVDGGGNVISGYQSGTSSYDPYLLYGPPPYFPTTGEYDFLSWEQVN